MNQEEQIKKIQTMLESSDSNLFELGFQLMESVGLGQEVFKKYGKANYKIEDEQIWIKLHRNYPETWRIFTKKIENLVHSKYERKTVRKIHNIFIELTHEVFRIPLLEFEEPNILFLIIFQESKVIIEREFVCQNDMVEKSIKIIEKLNPLDKSEIKNQYSIGIKRTNMGLLDSDDNLKLEWLDIRRKCYPNPIQYEFQPFDTNYSTFKVQVTITVKV